MLCNLNQIVSDYQIEDNNINYIVRPAGKPLIMLIAINTGSSYKTPSGKYYTVKGEMIGFDKKSGRLIFKVIPDSYHLRSVTDYYNTEKIILCR